MFDTWYSGRDAGMPSSGPSPPTKCNGRCTLIVENEPAISNLFKLIISSVDPRTRIDQAVNKQDAVQAFGRKHHYLLVMDVDMPRKDGSAAFSEIRELCLSRSWDMPAVVFCSGLPARGLVKRALQEDSRYFCLLRKPVHYKAFVAAIKNRLCSPTVAPKCPES